LWLSCCLSMVIAYFPDFDGRKGHIQDRKWRAGQLFVFSISPGVEYASGVVSGMLWVTASPRWEATNTKPIYYSYVAGGGICRRYGISRAGAPRSQLTGMNSWPHSCALNIRTKGFCYGLVHVSLNSAQISMNMHHACSGPLSAFLIWSNKFNNLAGDARGTLAHTSFVPGLITNNQQPRKKTQ